MSYEAFPGGDLIEKAFADSTASRETVESLSSRSAHRACGSPEFPCRIRRFRIPRSASKIGMPSRTPIPLTLATTRRFAGW